MKMAGLLNRTRRTLPGLSGTARVDRNVDALLRRIGAGDIAVVDRIDLDRVTAEALVSAGAVAVVNVAPSISGRFPNLGPEALIAAGLTLIDGVGDDVMRRVRDGSRIRLHDGAVFIGEEPVAHGLLQTAESVAAAMAGAKEGLSNQLEAFSANTIEFMHQDRALLLDGVGVPDVRVGMAGQHVLVVAPSQDTAEELAALRRYIKEYHPVLVGVNSGAEALWRAGHRPDLMWPTGRGGRPGADQRRRRGGAGVRGRPRPGAAPVQDLGVGAVTFPASGNPEDLALLLAHHHGANLIVTVGYQATLAEFLDRGRASSNASTFLTRLRVGSLLVDGKAVAALHRSPISAGAVLMLIGAVAIAVLATLLASDAGPALFGYLERALDWTTATAHTAITSATASIGR